MDAEWTAEPFSVMGQTFDWFLLPDDPAEQVGYKRGLGFDAEHWLGSIFKTGGDDGRSWQFRTRHGFREDKLAAYLPAAHAQGLKVLVYLNVHWFKEGFAEEMLARDADGSPMSAYGAGCLTCPAGPFLDYCVALAEDLGEYEVDGAFLDGPMATVCWCEHCRREYHSRWGEEMPAGQLTLPLRRRMEQWNAEKVARFVGEFRRALRRKQPGAIVYHNGSTLPRLTWANRAAVKEADLLGIEGGFIGYQPLAGQFLYKTSATGKLLEALAGGKPTVVFNDHAFKGYDYWPLPRAELDLLFAATLATGANPWYLLYYHNRDTQAGEAARYWNSFLAAHRGLLAGTRSADRAALLWSDSTTLVARAAREEADSVHHQARADVEVAQAVKADHMSAFQGAYALLARSGVGFRLVTEADLAAGLDGVDVLVAPSAAAMEEAAFAGLESFLRGGGILLADDNPAVLDEHARPRDRRRLAEMLGAAALEEIPFAQKNTDYIARGGGRLFKGLTAAPLPRPTRAFRVAMAGGKPLAWFHEPLAGRYDYLTAVSKMPAVIEHAFGAGRVIYMPMNLFEHYRAFGFDDLRLLATNALGRRWKPPVQVRGLGGRGEVFVRAKPGRLFVHLLNYGGPVRPFAEVAPRRGVKLIMREGRPAAAHALHAGRELPIRSARKGHSVRLPRLDVAETIVLEMHS